MTDIVPAAGKRGTGFLLAVVALGFLFIRPLSATVEFAAGSELQSHILLIPFVSAYLARLKKAEMPTKFGANWALGLVLVAIAVLAIATGVVAGQRGLFVGRQDALALPVFAFVVLLTALAAFFLGSETVRVQRFPLLFLFFMVPMPELLAHGLREGLQRMSAEAAHGLFVLTGTPVFRNGMVFHLSGLTVEVAEQCSGIHSTLVLLIASLVAAHLFLRRTWSRTVLMCAVIPLGVLRNGFRVVLLSLLAIHVDPAVMDSPLHHRGGPIFFAMSLVVLLGLLWWLRRIESKRERRQREA
jgi:exosortase C (VPDSG-CTERM-specific)